MARITFLVGNGFDLNVGMETRYTDFYKYFVKENPDDMLAKSIGTNFDYWSDLELGLGMFTAKITEENEDDFWKSEDNLEDSLADYLEMQINKINVNNPDKKKKIADEMRRSLSHFYSELPAEQHSYIEKSIYNTTSSIKYSFISFNYTNTLDTCVDILREIIPNEFIQHKSGNTTYSDVIGDILHIHGTTAKELVLGVNDISQIKSQKMAQNVFCRELLIKEETNRRYGQNKIIAAQNMINESIIICIFGMSIGSTDNMWWSYICKWLKISERNRLIIFSKRNDSKRRITKRELFLGQNELYNNYKNKVGLSDEEWKKIEKQINIIFDTNIFNFDLVEEKIDI